MPQFTDESGLVFAFKEQPVCGEVVVSTDPYRAVEGKGKFKGHGSRGGHLTMPWAECLQKSSRGGGIRSFFLSPINIY